MLHVYVCPTTHNSQRLYLFGQHSLTNEQMARFSLVARILTEPAAFAAA